MAQPRERPSALQTQQEQEQEQEQEGVQAVQLAHELQDRIARERRTVQALKAHLLAVAQEDEPAPEPAPAATAASDGADEIGWSLLGPDLSFRRQVSVDGVLLLELAGEVDMSASLRLRSLVSDLLEACVERVVLDLSRLALVDSNGLSTLLWLRRQALAIEASFEILPEVHPQLLRLLHVTRLDSILLPR